MHRHFAPLLLSVCLGLVACGDANKRTLTVDGIERFFLLHVPADVEGPAPVVFALHGGTGSAENMRRQTGFHEIGEREGFITVYPNARYENWNDGRMGDELKESAEDVDDHAYLLAVLEAVADEVEIDRERVYITGPSNGGIMTYAVACAPTGAHFAAIAPVIGSIAEDTAPDCSPTHPLPMLAINGSADEFIRPEGGEVYKGGRGRIIPPEEALETILAANRCEGEPALTTQDDVEDDETSLSVRTWTSCTGGAEVEHILVEGGGHNWPGGREVLDFFVGTTSQEFDASERIWSFFKRFSRIDAP